MAALLLVPPRLGAPIPFQRQKFWAKKKSTAVDDVAGIEGIKPSKYRAQKIEIDGIRFDSKREAKHWQQLQLRQAAGEISRLERQVRFPLHVAGDPIIFRDKRINKDGTPRKGRQAVYIADFRYFDLMANKIVVADSKGFQTPESRLKIAVVEAVYRFHVEIM